MACGAALGHDAPGHAAAFDLAVRRLK